MKVNTRILIVDDHALVRQGLRLMIEQEEDLSVCGEAESRLTALSIAQETHPNVALVDLSLGEDSGLDLLKDLTLRIPDLRVVILSMLDESIYAERTFSAGAVGYVMKGESGETVIEAIRTVMGGGIYTSPHLAEQMMRVLTHHERESDRSPVKALTDRELDVFQRVGQGHSTREIAAALSLSGKTIETYRSRIKSKLGLRNATELMQTAIQWVLEHHL
ncbi:MAG: response regulator [Planctomycetota bacterium]|jgi:DNA-binding NarL/FixJ family response regulator